MDEQAIMNEKDFQFFKELVEAPSPSGFEQPAQRVIRKALANVVDDVRGGATSAYGRRGINPLSGYGDSACNGD